jgi:hypothetical protein
MSEERKADPSQAKTVGGKPRGYLFRIGSIYALVDERITSFYRHLTWSCDMTDEEGRDKFTADRFDMYVFTTIISARWGKGSTLLPTLCQIQIETLSHGGYW